MIQQRRRALVTGASAGIGEAFARLLAEEGFDLILTARRGERLAALATALRAARGVAVEWIAGDLARPDGARLLLDEIAGRNLTVDVLINNAGLGLARRYDETPWPDQRGALQVMVLAPAELCHALLPGMMARRWGRIVNVASLAAFAPVFPGSSLYPAAKAFVVRMSESLAVEAEGSGVHVLASCPGFTRTEFHDVAKMRMVVDRIPPGQWQSAAAVARESFDAVMAGRGPILITGRSNRVLAAVLRWAPASLVRAIVRRHPLSRRAAEAG